MSSKITLTLTIDDEILAPEGYERAMAETLDLLRANGIGPTTKIAFTLEFTSEDDAIDARNELRVTLGARPSGVDADVKFETKEGIARAKMAKVTPMDRAWGSAVERAVEQLWPKAGEGIEAVELSAGGHTVRLEPR